MDAELLGRDGEILLVRVTEPWREIVVLGLAVLPAREEGPGIGLAFGFSRRRFVRRPWAPGQALLYDEEEAP